MDGAPHAKDAAARTRACCIHKCAPKRCPALKSKKKGTLEEKSPLMVVAQNCPRYIHLEYFHIYRTLWRSQVRAMLQRSVPPALRACCLSRSGHAAAQRRALPAVFPPFLILHCPPADLCRRRAAARSPVPRNVRPRRSRLGVRVRVQGMSTAHSKCRPRLRARSKHCALADFGL